MTDKTFTVQGSVFKEADDPEDVAYQWTFAEVDDIQLLDLALAALNEYCARDGITFTELLSNTAMATMIVGAENLRP